MKTKAIVTGHSRGLGEAIAAALLDSHVDVLGLSRRSSAHLAATNGAKLTQVALDLGDAAALADRALADRIEAFCAGAERVLLVNNAGMVKPIGPVGTGGAEAIAKAVTLNVTGPLVLADLFQAVAAPVRDRRILHISSGAGRRGMAGWSIYCATKAALDNHARAVAEDGIAGLRISSLAPGVIDTDMQADIRGSTVEQFPAIDQFKAMKADGVLSSPAEAGTKIADHLLSDGFGNEVITDLRNL
ncbi:SDR family oxidoreductase [Mesorhizobium sp. YIM 152430]|uniref:SDR family oxidoreductase n=1 Tax=Mesorhizobium sp. YIM 152430 TaxID=3031761 RepID=UPI0023DA842D|nr:SDR family oxidoreductase [Mesorhizobium sp. YIM 152430]MDF1598888.1 SDR family oxidoreductase [Mesorhizobium sp. YIM 152430]